MVLAQELRDAVLQAAMQGKLTGYTDDELVSLDEMPFAIPTDWKCVTLSDIGELSRGKSKHRPRNDEILYVDGTIPLIQTGDIASANKYITRYNMCYNKKGLAQSKLWEKGTLCITIAANIGDVAILGFDACFPDSVLGFLLFANVANIEYVYYMLVSYKNQMNQKASKVAQSNLSLNKINSIYFPLPPIAEQHRIVERVNAIMEHIDEYEKIEQELVKLKADFPGDMRAAILQAAMQGKLTEQLESDSSVEDLLKEIKPTLQSRQNRTKRKSKQTNIELFDIPDSWRWAKLSECGNTNIGLTYSPQNQVIDSGTIVLRSSNIQNGKMDYADIVRVDMDVPKNKMCHIGDILICTRNGSKKLVGKSALIDKEGMAFGAFMAVYRSKCNPYISYVLNSPHFRKSVLGGAETTTINQVTQDMIENYMIPLPPVEKQQRIVERLDALLPMCEDLI